MTSEIRNIIFDLGGVLIDWNPEYVFLDVFKGDRNKMDWFLNEICTTNWNEEQDAGYSLQKATEERIAMFPQHESLIKMYYGRWEEMLGGPIHESVELFKELCNNKNYRLIALTNWSAETFPIALKRYGFLHWFEGIVVSGTEKTRKPFPEIYKTTLERFDMKPHESLFIDDNSNNIKAARDLGIHGIEFTSASALKYQLQKLHGIQLTT